MRFFARGVVLPIALACFDLVALNAAFLTALYLRFHEYAFSHWAPRFGLPYLYLLIASNVIYLLLLFYYKELSFPRRFKPTHVLPRVAWIVVILSLASVMLIFLSKGLARGHQVFHFSRPTLVVFWTITFIYVSVGRFLFGVIQLTLFGRGLLVSPALLVGSGKPLEELRHRLRFNRWFAVDVVGEVSVASRGGNGLDVLPDAEGLTRKIRDLGVREVFLAIPPDDLNALFESLHGASGAGVVIRMIPGHLQLCISHLLLSEAPPVENLTKEDLVFQLYQKIDSRYPLDLASIAMIGAKGIPPTFGGIEHHVSELTHRLARLGFNMKVYSRPYYTSAEGRFQGVEIIRLPTIYTKHLDAITHSFLATLHIVIARVDIAHYHAQGPAILSFLPRLLGIRTVVTVHGLDWKRDKWGSFAKKCLRFGEVGSARFPTRTIAVSRTLQKYYANEHKRVVAYIPNGIEVGEMPGSEEIRERYGLEPRKFLLFVGRLVPEKGCHYLIEAFRKTDTKMKLVFAGGSSHSDEYADQLKAAAEGDDRILFLGYVYGEVLNELYAHNYIYVHPSDLEGLSIALLEALAFGACVLASDIPENTEVLCDEDTPDNQWNRFPPVDAPPVGFRFNKSDPDDLARMMRVILDDPESAEAMRAKTREWLRERYDWDSVARETAEIYREIVRK